MVTLSKELPLRSMKIHEVHQRGEWGGAAEAVKHVLRLLKMSIKIPPFVK